MSTAAPSRLHALSPFGPIFGKELRTTARRRRSYVLRVAYLGLLLLVLLWVWAIAGGRSVGSGVAAQMQAQAEMGAAFFASFAIFSVTAMAAVGPVLTSTAVGSERLAKTLPVLLMTPISGWQIVSGKLFSRALIALTLLGLSLPVLAVVRLLGGVELWAMGAAVCVAATTVLFTAALGLLLSTLMNRAYAVILLAYGVLLLLYLFVPIIVEANLNGVAGGQRAFFQYVAWNNPFLATALLVEPSGFARRFAPSAWAWCSAFNLAMTALLVFTTALILRRVSRRMGEGGSPPSAEPPPSVDVPTAAIPAPDAPVGAAAHAPTLPYATPTKRRHFRRDAPLREVSDRPVLWKELRRPLMARRWQAVVGFILAGGLLVGTYASIAANSRGELARADTQIAYAIVFHGLAWLFVSVLAATVIAQEKESDTWTLLLATPLSGAVIVWGKVLGLLRRLLWPAVLMAGHFAVFTVGRVLSPLTFLVILWVIFSFNSLWVATGVYLSLRFRKVTAAVIVNLLLAVGALGVTPMVLAIAGELAVNRGDRWAEQVLWYMPYWYLGEWIDHYDDSRHRSGVDFSLPGPVAGTGDRVQVTAHDYLTLIAAVGCLHLLMAILILQRTARRFDHMVGRTPQSDRARPVPAAPSSISSGT